jgi:selenocysteine-specific elongation factor
MVLGVIGHVDHGKTALVRALTGIDTDRLPEERRRGISIALGFAHFSWQGVSIDMIDMPGHERFVRTMIGGATGIGAVLLVVAANEGIKPQTIEHAEIAALLGLREVVIAVSKSDLVSKDRSASVAAAAAKLADEVGLSAPQPIMTSAATGAGVPALMEAIGGLLSRLRSAADDGFGYLPIDRSFSVPGHGTVVTGTLRRGKFAAGDELELVPTRRQVRIRALQVHGISAQVGLPGQRVAVNLRAIDAGEVHRGLALAPPGLLTTSEWLTVELTAAPSARSALPTAARQRLLYATSEADAVVRLLDRDELAPGESCFAQLRCAPWIALPVREHVLLRSGTPLRTVAGGRVLEAGGRRLRRHDPLTAARLSSLARDLSDVTIARELERAGARGTSVAMLARTAGIGQERVRRELSRLGAIITRDVTFTGTSVGLVMSAVLRVLERHWTTEPEGLSRDQILSSLKGCGPETLDVALARLGNEGRVQRAGRIRLIRPEYERARADADALLALRLAEDFRRGGLTPPTDPPGSVTIRRALDQLVRQGLLVRTVDKVHKREVLFHRDAIDHARRVLRPLLDGPGLRVTEAGATLGISRKFSVPLLEFLDQIQFTRRVGDRRVLRAPRGNPEE